MKQERFLFYTNWKERLDLLTDEQLRRFINNLCAYAKDEEVVLKDSTDKMVWFGIVPSLDINRKKYEKKVITNRENGKLGGAPRGNKNALKEKQPNSTQNNLISDNREVINDNSKGVIDKFQKNKDEYKKNKDNTA